MSNAAAGNSGGSRDRDLPSWEGTAELTDNLHRAWKKRLGRRSTTVGLLVAAILAEDGRLSRSDDDSGTYVIAQVSLDVHTFWTGVKRRLTKSEPVWGSC